MRHLCQTTRTETADKGMVSASCEIFAKQMVDAERYWKSIQQVCLRCNVLQAHTRHAFHCWLKKGFSVLLLLNIFIIYKDIFVTRWSIYEPFVCVCVINVDFSFHTNNKFFPVKTIYIYIYFPVDAQRNSPTALPTGMTGFYMKLGGSQCRWGHVLKISIPDSQPIDNRNTDGTI